VSVKSIFFLAFGVMMLGASVGLEAQGCMQAIKPAHEDELKGRVEGESTVSRNTLGFNSSKE